MGVVTLVFDIVAIIHAEHYLKIPDAWQDLGKLFEDTCVILERFCDLVSTNVSLIGR